MKLHDFLEKFLPGGVKMPHFMETSEMKLMWLYRNFPEALDNYTAQICKKQREKCFENFMVGDIALKTAILNAPQPKIDEL